jgi:hypothetical protein
VHLFAPSWAYLDVFNVLSVLLYSDGNVCVVLCSWRKKNSRPFRPVQNNQGKPRR